MRRLLALLIVLALCGCVEIEQHPIRYSTPAPTPTATPVPAQTPAPEVGPTPMMHENMRWNHMPLRVYIEKNNVPGFRQSYVDDVKRAMRAWEDATNRLVRFVLVDDEEGADITIRWVEFLRKKSADTLGICDTEYEKLGKWYLITKAEIELLTRERDVELSDLDMQNVAAHEIGHALGLDHSGNENSVMWPKITVPSDSIKYPTNWDVANLIDIYATPPLPELELVTQEMNLSKTVQRVLITTKNYLNIDVVIKNSGILDAKNVVIRIKADGKVVKEEKVDVGYGSKLTISYTNIYVGDDFRRVEVDVDPENLIDEYDEGNNIALFEIG